MLYFIATGGTIAMKQDPLMGGPVPALDSAALLEAVPDMRRVDSLEAANLSNIPSGHMTPAHWVALHQAVCTALARPDVAGTIISHGTDTLEETAWFLDLTVNSPKPVVLVGAQHSASDPDFDGPRNLLGAARICAAPEARNKGVMLCLNGNINAARDVTKTHTSNVETFKSGELGFLGTVDQDRIVFYRQALRRQHISLLPTAPQSLPRVDIVAMYAGADGVGIRAAQAAGASAIVIAALGMGNVSIAAAEAIREVRAAGTQVIIASRVPNGRVIPHYAYPGGGKDLAAMGCVFADNLSPQKARILALLALQHVERAEALQEFFDR